MPEFSHSGASKKYQFLLQIKFVRFCLLCFGIFSQRVRDITVLYAAIFSTYPLMTEPSFSGIVTSLIYSCSCTLQNFHRRHEIYRIHGGKY